MPDESIYVPVGLTVSGLLGKRYLARFIDSILIGLVSILIFRLFRAVGALNPGPPSALLLEIVLLVLWMVLWLAYGSLFESSPWQATLGKQLMGLRVYDSHGERLRLPQAVMRNLVKDGPFLILSLVPSGPVLSLIWLGAHIVVLHRSPVYQAIHDRAAGSWVAAPEETIQLRLT